MFRYVFRKLHGLFWCYIEALIRLVAAIIADRFLPEFKHKRLKQNDKFFRLVTIEPRKWDCLIHCSVKEMELNTTKNYEALSYTWYMDRDTGSPVKGRMRTIICNGRKLKVYQNLHNALLQLRKLNRGCPVWIDAICIDQADGKEMSEEERDERKNEKSAQVNMMKSIFGSANTVVVWLGRSTMITRVAVKLLREALSYPKEKFAQIFNLLQQGADNHQNYRAYFHLFGFFPYVAALYWIFTRGIFERVWTLQEMVLAREMVYLLGDEEFPALELSSYFRPMDRSYEENESDTISFDMLGGSTDLALSRLQFANITRRDFLCGTECPLEDAIKEIRRRKTTKPQDKFFSVLSISPLTKSNYAERSMADYKKPIVDVYCDGAVQLLHGPTGIHLLSLVGQLRYGAKNHPKFPSGSTKRLIKDIEFIPGLPSWVPDLSTEVRPRPFRNLLWHADFKSTKSMKAEFSVHRGGRSLRVKAAILDIIEYIGDCIDAPGVNVPWHFLAIPLLIGSHYQPTDEETISAFRKTLVSGEKLAASWRADRTPEITSKDFAEWFAFMADATPGFWMEGARHILAENDMSFRRSEMMELSNDPNFTWRANATKAKGKQRINIIRRFIDVFDGPEYCLRERIKKRHERNRQGQFYAARNYTGLNFQFGEAIDPPPYKRVFETRYLHRRLFLTKKQYMGTGPWTIQTGDVVMLVAGAEQPYIFRPSYKGRDTWELIGEAYCHGFMHGEALDLPDLKFEMREIV